jgi:hypothetical protein
VFITLRDDFERDCEVWLFGHALMEKLVSPYKAITAHAWGIVAITSFYAMAEKGKRIWLDGILAAQLGYDFATSNFSPLPVLGTPGWWSGQDEAFYADKSIFRPPRIRRM